MNVNASVASLGLCALSIVSPVHAQENNGNPTILREVQALQTLLQSAITQIQTLQGSVDELSDRPAGDPRRLFYLTTSRVNALGALNACAAGFHFASLWEIFDTSNLKYD